MKRVIAILLTVLLLFSTVSTTAVFADSTGTAATVQTDEPTSFLEKLTAFFDGFFNFLSLALGGDGKWYTNESGHWHVMLFFHQADAAPHDWNIIEILQAPTCKADGSKRVVCTVCNYATTIAIPALPHTWDAGVITTPASCYAKGIKTYTCAACGSNRYEYLDKLEHTWNAGVQTKDPTCVTLGEKTLSCTVCYETKKETVPMLPHKLYDVWDSNETAHWKVCEVCRQEFEKAEHNRTNPQVVKAPTCQETGTTNYTCDICSKTYSVTVPKLADHIFGDYQISENEHWKECVYCKMVSQKENHIWEVTSKTEPTCISQGQQSVKCQICGKTADEVLAMTPHTYAGWSTSETQHWKTCVNENCTNEISRGNHIWHSVSFLNGTHRNYCETCDYFTVEDCNTDGTDGVCSKCGYKEPPKSITVNGENYSSAIITDPKENDDPVTYTLNDDTVVNVPAQQVNGKNGYEKDGYEIDLNGHDLIFLLDPTALGDTSSVYIFGDNVTLKNSSDQPACVKCMTTAGVNKPIYLEGNNINVENVTFDNVNNTHGLVYVNTIERGWVTFDNCTFDVTNANNKMYYALNCKDGGTGSYIVVKDCHFKGTPYLKYIYKNDNGAQMFLLGGTYENKQIILNQQDSSHKFDSKVIFNLVMTAEQTKYLFSDSYLSTTAVYHGDGYAFSYTRVGDNQYKVRTELRTGTYAFDPYDYRSDPTNYSNSCHYRVKDNGDGTWTIYTEEYIDPLELTAKNATGYLANGAQDRIFKLKENVEVDFGAAYSLSFRDVTIDLNGYNLTFKGNTGNNDYLNLVATGSYFNITNSNAKKVSELKFFNQYTDNYAGICFKANTCDINIGNVKFTGANNGAAVVKLLNGNITLNNCTLASGNANAAYALICEESTTANPTAVTLNNCSFTGTDYTTAYMKLNQSDAKVTLNNCTFAEETVKTFDFDGTKAAAITVNGGGNTPSFTFTESFDNTEHIIGVVGGTFNFDPTAYVDTDVWDVIENQTDPITWTLMSKEAE